MSESNEEMKGNETKQDEPKREKVRVVDISLIKDFPDHPFQVKDDESMAQLVESIRMNGVLNPVIALKIDENHYQLISGHRRKHACILLGIDRIPLRTACYRLACGPCSADNRWRTSHYASKA